MKAKLLHAVSVTLLYWLLAPLALADPLLYRVESANANVWLLGSVHALRAQDHPLDARLDKAYENAKRIVLEVDPAQLDPMRVSAIAMQKGRFQQGGLTQVFSNEEYRHLEKGLAVAGMDIRNLEPFKPWFIGLQLLSLNLLRHGYAVDSGIDRHFGDRAIKDGKETVGLETVEEQLDFFDGLSMEAQKALLLEAVADSGDFGTQMDTLIDAWRHGDVEALENLADESLHEKDLRDSLLGARNQRWAKEILKYLGDDTDTLVIVGALHLVGDDGLVRLLEEAGHEVKRVRGDGAN